MTLTPRLRPVVYLLLLGSSWGLYFSLLKIAVLSGISYIGIVTLTTVGVGIGMALIAMLRRRFPVFDFRHSIFYLVCALLGYLLPMIAEIFVIRHMPVGVLTLIVSMTPLVTLLIAWIMKTDAINTARVGGILLGAIAIFVILLPDAHFSEAVDWQWLFLAAIIPACYGIYHNYIARYWPEGSDSYQVACGEAIYASLLLIGFSIFNWQWQDLQSWNQGHSVIVLMAMIALIDIYFYFELIRLKGPIYTSHANYFMVVSGVMWGVVIFAEQPSLMMWLSTVLLIASLYLISRRRELEETGESP